ncbi:MAG: hypothetical protein AB4426_20215 [Xenococcaceae cyanobacterium]
MEANLPLWSKVNSWYQLERVSSAIAAIPVYIEKLRAIAQDMKARGKEVEDRVFPVDVLSVHPPHPVQAPLILFYPLPISLETLVERGRGGEGEMGRWGDGERVM